MGEVIKKRVRWNASSSPDVTGYKFYWEVGGGVNYDSRFSEVGNSAEITLPDEVPSFPVVTDEIEIGITAVTQTGNESDMLKFRAPFRFSRSAIPKGPGRESVKAFHFNQILSLMLLSILMASAIWLYFYSPFSRSSNRITPPIFEEIHSTPTNLHKLISRVDYAIIESLRRHGIQEPDIAFLEFQPIHQDGHVWEITELSVKCSDAQSASELLNNLTGDISKVGPQITLEVDDSLDDEMIGWIYIEDFSTHKLILRFESIKAFLEDKGDRRPQIAIIVDDLGYDPEIASAFMKLDLPLTLSILPFAPFTDRIVREANKTKCKLLMHLPMEPKGNPLVDPGPGALYRSMTDNEIERLIEENLRQVPGAIGANNHMGSSFTEDSKKMKVVLRELKKRNLFFVDSMTTRQTVGFALAAEMGIPAAKRDVFLDNDLNPKAIERQLDRLLSMAKHSGTAIGIIHPHKESLTVLKAYVSRLKQQSEIVAISELVS